METAGFLGTFRIVLAKDCVPNVLLYFLKWAETCITFVRTKKEKKYLFLKKFSTSHMTPQFDKISEQIERVHVLYFRNSGKALRQQG